MLVECLIDSTQIPETQRSDEGQKEESLHEKKQINYEIEGKIEIRSTEQRSGNLLSDSPNSSPPPQSSNLTMSLQAADPIAVAKALAAVSCKPSLSASKVFFKTPFRVPLSPDVRSEAILAGIEAGGQAAFELAKTVPSLSRSSSPSSFWIFAASRLGTEQLVRHQARKRARADASRVDLPETAHVRRGDGPTLGMQDGSRHSKASDALQVASLYNTVSHRMCERIPSCFRTGTPTFS